MRVLCGQCGHVNELDDDFAEPAVPCARCGREISLAAPGPDVAPESDGEEIEPAEDELGFAEQARRAEQRKITIVCEHCGRSATVSARIAGQKARCKGCNEPIEIPFPDDLEDFRLPRIYRDRGDRAAELELVPPPEEGAAAAEDLDGEAARRSLAEYDPGGALAALDRGRQPAGPPETPAAPPGPQAEQLADAVEQFAGTRPGAARARRRRAKGSPAVRWALSLAIAALAVAVPLAVVLPAWMVGDGGENLADLIDHDAPDGNLAAGGAGLPAAPTPRTAPVGAASAPGRAKPPAPPGGSAVPTCRVLAAVASPFAGPGRLPAPARSIYWRLSVRVTAGDERLFFRNHGTDVRLVFGAERYNSLGSPGGEGGPFAPPGRLEDVSIPPGRSRELTFLFLVPAEHRAGGLFIRRVAYRAVELPPEPGVPAVAPAGTWQEQPPRHLRPLLRDPVMAAVQEAPGQHLRVGPAEGGGIRVGIPEARVLGAGRAVAPGLFALTLEHDGAVLRGAMLRFVEGGRRAVLYLADEPYHQLTYVNPAIRRPATRPASRPGTRPAGGASRPAGEPAPSGPPVREPGIRPVSDNEDPPFSPSRPVRKSRPQDLPTGPSIFD